MHDVDDLQTRSAGVRLSVLASICGHPTPSISVCAMNLLINTTTEHFTNSRVCSSRVQVYHLHCNGVFHCYFRYSQAWDLCEAVSCDIPPTLAKSWTH